MIALKETPQVTTMTIDGMSVDFTVGETIYEVAQRVKKSIPTLCYDPRLEAFGACRLCVVEVAGIRNPVASCTTQATAGMVVKTKTATIEKHRKTLLELVASENRNVGDIDQLAGYASQELGDLFSLALERDDESRQANFFSFKIRLGRRLIPQLLHLLQGFHSPWVGVLKLAKVKRLEFLGRVPAFRYQALPADFLVLPGGVQGWSEA